MAKLCQALGGFLVIDDLFAAAFDRMICAFPTFEDDTLFGGAGIYSERGCHHCFIALLENVLDDIAFLSHADTCKWTVRNQQGGDGEMTAIGAAALPEAH